MIRQLGKPALSPTMSADEILWQHLLNILYKLQLRTGETIGDPLRELPAYARAGPSLLAAADAPQPTRRKSDSPQALLAAEPTHRRLVSQGFPHKGRAKVPNEFCDEISHGEYIQYCEFNCAVKFC